MPVAAKSRKPARPTTPGGREALLEAALLVIAEGGVDSVTHRSVARAAGLSPGAATYHFASRDDMVYAALEHHLEWTEGQAHTLGPVGESDEALVRQVVEMSRRLCAEPHRLHAEYELVLYAARTPRLAAEFNVRLRGMIAYLAEALERLGAANPLEAARTVLSVARGFELEVLTQPGLELDRLGARLEVVVGALLAH